jgi:hypothetical protein
MKNKILPSLIFFTTILVSSLVMADGPLTIMTDDSGCPTDVSSDGSCPAGFPGGAACRASGARVQWISNGNAIQSIFKKADSEGQLRGCNGNGPAEYHCSAVGASGTYIDYNVQLENCPPYDPTIIIR